MNTHDYRPPTERVCRSGCSPDPQPIGNFYTAGLSAGKLPLYQFACKKCTVAREKARYALRKPRSSGLGRGNGATGKMKPLEGVDLKPCGDCGLRGHEPGDVDRCNHAMPFHSGMGNQGPEWLI